MHLDILYKEVSICLCSKIISSGDILILTLLGNKVYADCEPPTTMADMIGRHHWV